MQLHGAYPTIDPMVVTAVTAHRNEQDACIASLVLLVKSWTRAGFGVGAADDGLTRADAVSPALATNPRCTWCATAIYRLCKPLSQPRWILQGVTLNVVEPDTAPAVAEMSVEPGETARASPFEAGESSIVATVVSDDAHVEVGVRSTVEPSL